MDNNAAACCPYCGSTSLSVSRRGYRLGRGLFWALVLGFFNFWLFAVPGFLVGVAIGLVIGNVGSKKIKVVCLNCGREHKPARRQTANRPAADTQEPPRSGWDEPPIPSGFAEYLRETGQDDPRYSGRNNALECVLIDMADDKERAVMWAYAVDCARHSRTMGNILHAPDYFKYRAFGEYASRHGDVLRSIADRRAYEYWSPTTTTKAYRAAREFLG